MYSSINFRLCFSIGFWNFQCQVPVLDLQLDGDLKSLPVGGGLGDVVTNLLWRQTQRTHLVEKKNNAKYIQK